MFRDLYCCKQMPRIQYNKQIFKKHTKSHIRAGGNGIAKTSIAGNDANGR